MKIINGLPHTPYFIFFKGIVEKSDKEILKLLDLTENIEEIRKEEDLIYISRDNVWVHLMDNWFYTYWHSKKLSGRINQLGKKYEIFTCSVGECDMSFDFRYFKEGKKVREYIVESPNYNDEVLKVNFGSPLKGETEGLKKRDPFYRITDIAKSLGIEIPKKTEQIKSYGIII